MADVVAILLAAGESRRMGRLKALLPWQGVSLIKHQVASLRAGGVDQVVVVLGHRSDELKAELGELRKTEGQRGEFCSQLYRIWTERFLLDGETKIVIYSRIIQVSRKVQLLPLYYLLYM